MMSTMIVLGSSRPPPTALSFPSHGTMNHLYQSIETTNLDWIELTSFSPYTLTNTDGNAKYFDLGPQRDSLKIVIPVTVIYILIFISGIIGNISTCIVIKKNRSMHTATNYYLFSLAISDFLLLISGVPQEVYFIWSKYPYIFGEHFCIGRGVLAETSANATVLTITAFTVERYIAICHPFWGQAMSKLSRAIRIIILIWVFSVVAAVPQAAQFGIVVFSGVEKCAMVRQIIQHSFQLATFIFFFAPMTIIVVLYLLIGLRLYRSNMIGGTETVTSDKMIAGGTDSNVQTVSYAMNGGTGSGRDSGNGSGKRRTGPNDSILYRYSGGTQLTAVRGRMNQYGTRRVLKMLVAVVCCFFLCWAPFHAQRLIAVYGPLWMLDNGGDNSDYEGSGSNDGISDGDGDSLELDKIHQETIYTVMTYVSGVLYYLSTCINPLLYNLMSNKFREAFRAILFRKKANGSIRSCRQQESSKRLRRNPTLTSSTQRESTDSELQTKPSTRQTLLNERKVGHQSSP